MSFKRKGTVLGKAVTPSQKPDTLLPPGVKRSSLDNRLVISTGTQSLDDHLAGYGGLPLGTSLLVEEDGTTDFSGVILRYFAAQGLVDGHDVHVLGVSEAWRNELPAVDLSHHAPKENTPSKEEGRMKIAWRYQALGNNRADHPGTTDLTREPSFCHSFNLSKRLQPSAIRGNLYITPLNTSPLPSLETPDHLSSVAKFTQQLTRILESSANTHRIIIPSLLSPTLHSSSLNRPENVLPIIHELRGLLRIYSNRLAIMISMPLTIQPRLSGITRWLEILCDGVLHITAQEKTPDLESASGMLRFHCLPMFHERGGGGLDVDKSQEHLAFKLNITKGVVLQTFSLPPMGDATAQKERDETEAKPSLHF